MVVRCSGFGNCYGSLSPMRNVLLYNAEVMTHQEEKGSFMWEATCLGTWGCHFVSVCYHSTGVSVTRTWNDTDKALQTVRTYLSLSLHPSQPSRNANVYVRLQEQVTDSIRVISGVSALGQRKYRAPFQAKCPWRLSALVTRCSHCPAEGAAFPYVIICAGRSCFCWYATQGFLQTAKHFDNTKAIRFFFSLSYITMNGSTFLFPWVLKRQSDMQ